MMKRISPSEAARILGRLGGRKGGKAKARNMTPEQREFEKRRLQEIGRLGGLAKRKRKGDEK